MGGVDVHDLVKPRVGGVFHQGQVKRHHLTTHAGEFVVHEHIIAQGGLNLDYLGHVDRGREEDLQIGHLAVGFQRLQRGVIIGKFKDMRQFAGQSFRLVHRQRNRAVMGCHQRAELGHLRTRDQGYQHGTTFGNQAAQLVEIGPDPGIKR